MQDSVWENKKVLEMDGGNDWETMWMYLLMPQNCILKNDWNGKFCYICFTTINKKLSVQPLPFTEEEKDITQLVHVHIAIQ